MTQVQYEGNQTWDLAEPERIDPTRQPNISWSEAAKFSDERVKIIQNISENLKQEEEGFIKNERNFLENAIKFLQNFTKANQDFVNQEEQNISRIQEEIQKNRDDQQKFENLIRESQRTIEDTKRKIEKDNEEQRVLSTKRKEIADKIEPNELSSIKFKDFLDTSNDVFRWVLQAVYNESKANYAWTNFKKQVFVKDKGADFILRLKGINLQRLRKDDVIFGKSVLDRKTEILADLERKGKENVSLRALFDYIAAAVDVGKFHEEGEADKLQLDEQEKDLEKKVSDLHKVNNVVQMLEEKIRISRHYIDTLTRLRPLFNNVIDKTQERIEFQDQYQASVKGNAQALDTLTQSVVQNKQNVEQQIVEDFEVNGRNERVEKPKENNYYATPKEDEDRAQEEEQFAGEQNFSHQHTRKVESRNPVPATDLKESEFANSKKGSCESCNIF
jgi:hypothetical protein